MGGSIENPWIEPGIQPTTDGRLVVGKYKGTPHGMPKGGTSSAATIKLTNDKHGGEMGHAEPGEEKWERNQGFHNKDFPEHLKEKSGRKEILTDHEKLEKSPDTLGGFHDTSEKIIPGITHAKPSKEMVNHPSHYLIKTKNGDAIECLDAISILGMNFNVGNAFKYIWRCGRKNVYKQDIQKAIFYLQKELETLDK